MPPLREDPTFQILSLVFLSTIAWTAVACLPRVTRDACDPASPIPPQPGLPTTIYRKWDLALVLFLFLTFGLPLLMGPPPSGQAPSITAERIQSSAVMLILLAGFATLMAAFRIRPADWLGLRWKTWPSVLWIAPLSVMAIWTVFGILLWFGYEDWMKSLGVDPMQDSVRTLKSTKDPAILAWMCFAALVAAPVCEEVIFRGYCYPVLKKYAGTRSAMCISSLVFACAHGNLSSALPLFLLGLLLVLLYERTTSLWSAIAVHFLFNLATVVMLFRSRWENNPLEFP